MTNNDNRRFTANYNGEAIRPGEVMVPFEYTEMDAVNCTNPECIVTLTKAGRRFKVIYKAVPAEWAAQAKSQFNLIQNEELGHYAVPNSVSMDAMEEEYELYLAAEPAADEDLMKREELQEHIRIFRSSMEKMIEQSPKMGYAILLLTSGSKGAEFAEKMQLGHDAANNIRRSALEILQKGLINTKAEDIHCKRNKYTEVYRKEALLLLDEIISQLG